MKKRILSIVLTLAMVLSLFPAAIFASDEDGATEPVEGVAVNSSEKFAEALAQEEKDIVMGLPWWSSG